MQSSRSGASSSSSAAASTRSRNVSSPHWMSSNTTTSGACSSSSLRNAQAISSALAASVALAEQRADRRRRSRVGGKRAQLLDHLDHRPVGDALAVGKAAAAHDARVDRRERLGHEARLADPGLADDRDQLAARLRRAPLPARADLPSSRSRPTKRDSCERSGAEQRDEPEGGHRLALPFSSSGRPAPTSTASRTSSSVGSPIRTSPGAAACSRRAAMLTASPVASRSSVPVTTSPVLTPIRPCDAELRQRVAHLDRRSAGAQRVVLVRRRDAEHRHHRVADELLHRAAVRLDDRLHPLEVARQQRPQRLRIRRLPQRRRADHVAEQHRHRLADLARRRRGRERRAAAVAEAGTVRGCPARSSRRWARADAMAIEARPPPTPRGRWSSVCAAVGPGSAA